MTSIDGSYNEIDQIKFNELPMDDIDDIDGSYDESDQIKFNELPMDDIDGIDGSYDEIDEIDEIDKIDQIKFNELPMNDIGGIDGRNGIELNNMKNNDWVFINEEMINKMKNNEYPEYIEVEGELVPDGGIVLSTAAIDIVVESTVAIVSIVSFVSNFVNPNVVNSNFVNTINYYANNEE
tara:strand:+ start:3165 stop:3704 length:540 start_codon:yes stop_codon:yes gene_type:complete